MPVSQLRFQDRAWPDPQRYDGGRCARFHADDYQSSGSAAVTASIRWLAAGPTAQQVTVPGLT